MKAQAGAGRPGMCQCEFSATEKFLLFMDVRVWHPSHPQPLVWDPLHPTLGVRLRSVAFQSQWSGSSKNPEHLPPVRLFPREAAMFIGPATLHTFYSTWPTTLAIGDETGDWTSWHGAISAQEGNRILDGVAEPPLSWELCKKEEQLVADAKAECHSEAVRTKSARVAKCGQRQTARADWVKSWFWREKTRFRH